MEEEVFFQCPFCFSKISMIADLSVAEQHYVEDCEVCCNPLQVHLEIEPFERVISASVDSLEQ